MTPQPAPSAPISRARVAVKSSRACLRVWSMAGNGTRVSPSAGPGTANRLMPAAVRAATRITSAVAPSGTNVLLPVSSQPDGLGAAWSVTPASSHRPLASVTASVTVRPPAQMPSSSSAATGSPSGAASRVWAASTAVLKYGPPHRARPISSSTTP